MKLTKTEIKLPRFAMSFHRTGEVLGDGVEYYRILISWGDAEKELLWQDLFMKHNPEKIAESINDTLKELCAKSNPFRVY